MQLGPPSVFYGDFNCAFCYAQHERVERLGLRGRIELRPIQHHADLPAPRRLLSPSEAAKLDEELARVSSRAPEVPVGRPSGIPSTAPATLAFAALRRCAPGDAAQFARALFQGLWVHDRDISDPTVLVSIARAVGVALPPVGPLERADIAAWQLEWEASRFERRIPALLSAHDAVLLGLADERRLAAFIASGRLSAETDETCGS